MIPTKQLVQSVFLAITLGTAATTVRAETDDFFDYFRLAWQWGPTFCLKDMECTRDATAAFTVHGLWPNKFTGWHPANCNQRDPDYEFEKENVSEAVQNEMNCEWQSYKNNTTNEGFWEWEWEKHGTCALIFFKTWGDFDSPQDAYFTTTMELNNQYDLNDLFIDVPKPNTGLNVWDVRKLFEDTWNVSPWISCQKTTQIFEIYMCFNGTTLEPIDCRGGGNGTVCSSSSMLMLPEGAPVSDTCRVFA